MIQNDPDPDYPFVVVGESDWNGGWILALEFLVEMNKDLGMR